MTSLPALLEKVLPIAIQAGKAILEVYHRDDFEVQAKADNSPLTAADLASDSIIRAGLEKLDDQYIIVSEENRQVSYAARKSARRLWLVDPLDGTKEFLKRNDEFCVCIALIEAGRPILAIIHAPVTGLSYVATVNGGVQVIDAKGKVSQLSPKPEVRADHAPRLRFGVSRSHLSAATQDYLATFEKPAHVPMGSALKFCAIAEGQLDAYPRFGPTMEWDTAAGDLLIHEVGGQLVHAETGELLMYNKESLLNPFFIAKGWKC
ncbi:MAG: 3'(2'),5'-bisphosphate nucleotidase CysQ [Saprospiraceae bacterium]